jgi:hypothetical protein
MLHVISTHAYEGSVLQAVLWTAHVLDLWNQALQELLRLSAVRQDPFILIRVCEFLGRIGLIVRAMTIAIMTAVCHIAFAAFITY